MAGAFDVVASSSSSMPSSALASYLCYHVFISHSGLDVNATFVGVLYHLLISYRLQVFLDKPEMQPGHDILLQIEAAIGVAYVHVAIFSPRYVELKWCLNELSQMVQSMDSRGAVILPVFYNVKPHDLRFYEAYDKALRTHEKQHEAAIGVASVHVAIFSPRYAESKWCLNELLQMVQYMDSRGAVILPVFYNVKPRDVRFYEAYNKALRTHEKRQDLQNNSERERRS